MANRLGAITGALVVLVFAIVWSGLVLVSVCLARRR